MKEFIKWFKKSWKDGSRGWDYFVDPFWSSNVENVGVALFMFLFLIPFTLFAIWIGILFLISEYFY